MSLDRSLARSADGSPDPGAHVGLDRGPDRSPDRGPDPGPGRFVPRAPRRVARQRLLVLLASLLCALCAVCAAGSAGGHGGIRTAPPAAVSTEPGLEHPHDVLDTAFRSAARHGHRPPVRRHPAGRSAHRPTATGAHPRSRVRALHHAPAPRALRCMVLRC
ncbi:hypothetical protein C6Y14_32940 [Streptomyces dioscori]|uniref:Uncharacterized protein n=1 Tax=Streptomyces dioscori TaxID=2109333 RepID=A0A2P8PZ41_9ACTN|nr:hypothetical protein [Streptomyces dioscori]PSM39262.1 hypothetical protein C6Y14_32940 [Streptomyces dioscori]